MSAEVNVLFENAPSGKLSWKPKAKAKVRGKITKVKVRGRTYRPDNGLSGTHDV